MKTLVGLLATGALVVGTATLAPKLINRSVQTLSHQTESSHNTSNKRDDRGEKASSKKSLEEQFAGNFYGNWVRYDCIQEGASSYIEKINNSPKEGILQVGILKIDQNNDAYAIVNPAPNNSKQGTVCLIAENYDRLKPMGDPALFLPSFKEEDYREAVNFLGNNNNILHLGNFIFCRPGAQTNTSYEQFCSQAEGEWVIRKTKESKLISKYFPEAIKFLKNEVNFGLTCEDRNEKTFRWMYPKELSSLFFDQKKIKKVGDTYLVFLDGAKITERHGFTWELDVHRPNAFSITPRGPKTIEVSNAYGTVPFDKP